MSVSHQQLKQWLLDNYAAEEEPGYGHICADKLAEILLRDFSIKSKRELERARETAGAEGIGF